MLLCVMPMVRCSQDMHGITFDENLTTHSFRFHCPL
jgi:hypothetical protein